MEEGEARTGWWPRGKALITNEVKGLIGVVGLMTLLGLAVHPAYAEHDDKYVVCPAPILEGNTGRMQVRRPGYQWAGVTVFTYSDAYTADGSDFVGYDGVAMESELGSDRLWIPVITHEDSVPEYDETFSIGYWIEGTWHGCVVTILDDDIPEVADVEITSHPALGLAYRIDESVDVTVTFDDTVEVKGKPVLSLYVGDGPNWRGAEYKSGSGSRYLRFEYRVQLGDRDIDGLTVGAAAVDGDRNPLYGFSGAGRITAVGTDVPVAYTHSGVPGSQHHKVDGRPYAKTTGITSAPPDGWDAYRSNQTIEVSMRFDVDVEIEGDIRPWLYVGLDGGNWDEARREARYLRGSGTDTLVFGYTVRPGDMDYQGVMIALGAPGTGYGGDGTIKARGTDVEWAPHFWGTGHSPDHKVDTAPPTVLSVDIDSQPSSGDAYAAGESIDVVVTFSEKVTIVGDLQLELDVGGAKRTATLRSDVAQAAGPGRRFMNAIGFRYEIQDGDADIDGIGVGANSLRLNGGSIRDIAGNAAASSHSAVPADPDHKVDTSHGD